jgi:uncharacterized coiled-coil DUF342 family protein
MESEMMDDITARDVRKAARSHNDNTKSVFHIVQEMADRITALTAERDEWRKAYHKTHDLYASSEERADALAERLAKAVAGLEDMQKGLRSYASRALMMVRISYILAELKRDTP